MTKKLKNEIELAMLGIEDAAKRLTNKEVLLPCPMCGKIPLKKESSLNIIKLTNGKWAYAHCCETGLYDNDKKELNDELSGNITVYGNSKKEVIQKWNTRTPFLTNI